MQHYHIAHLFPEHTSFTSKWKLNTAELELCTQHFLRNWSEHEILEQLWHEDFTYISLNGTAFKVCWQLDPAVSGKLQYLAAKCRDLTVDIHTKQPYYWLSFRAGVDDAGNEFAYVLVQEDLKHGR